MKLTPRDAPNYFRKPNAEAAGLLIFGADTMRVATARQQVIGNLIGPEGEAEMRLTRIPATDLRKEPAALQDAMRAVSFFPGPRVALVEEANDTLTPLLTDAIKAWQPGDAQIIVTAGQLKGTSKLRKLFEGGQNTYCAGLYDNPPDAQEIERMLSEARVPKLTTDAREQLHILSRTLDPGDFRQTMEKLGLYKHGDSTDTTPEDIAAVAPQSAEAGVDDLIAIVAEARVGEIAGVLQRLAAQGMNPTTLCIGAMRHFRALHTAASDPGGAAQGIGKLRPPVFGPRRDAMARQASTWGRDRLEKALSLLLETDLQMRSATKAPAGAVMERALIRLAMMGRR